MLSMYISFVSLNLGPQQVDGLRKYAAGDLYEWNMEEESHDSFEFSATGTMRHLVNTVEEL